MSLRNQLRKLDPDVVDKAIYRVRFRLNIYSCVALSAASGLGGCEGNPYAIAYKRVTCKMGFEPVWWNILDDRWAPERTAALLDFKQAILDAHSSPPTLFERIKAWLTEPCEYGAYS